MESQKENLPGERWMVSLCVTGMRQSSSRLIMTVDDTAGVNHFWSTAKSFPGDDI